MAAPADGTEPGDARTRVRIPGRWRWPLRVLVVLLLALNVHYARRARAILAGLEIQGVRPLVTAVSIHGSEALVLSVPRETVVRRDGRDWVFEARTGRVWARAVQVDAAREAGRVVILDGLSGGEALVARPPDGLRDGDRVWLKP